MEEQETLIALGHEAEIFVKSNLGIYMQDRFDLEVEKAQRALSIVDPSDEKEIRRLQNIIAVYSDFHQWINDVIAVGDLTYQEYLSGNEE